MYVASPIVLEKGRGAEFFITSMKIEYIKIGSLQIESKRN